MSTIMKGAASNAVESEIEMIRSRMLLMGGTAVEMIKCSLEGLLNGSDESLQKTFELEEKVNDAEVEVDALCNKFIVLRAPAAYDLRFVLCTLRMIRDIERIGDEAEKMARMAKFFHDDVHTIAPKPNLSLMVNDVVQMLEKVLNAYARDDDSELRKVINFDQVVDEKFRQTLNDLMSFIINKKESVGCCIDLIFFAKALERIGDHAKNMSESVIFMIKGKDLRHVG